MAIPLIIVGGGASGMAAAITAAAILPPGSVTLLERGSRVGRKLLATGNGRCNLTNRGAVRKNYHGADPAFQPADFLLESSHSRIADPRIGISGFFMGKDSFQFFDRFIVEGIGLGDRHQGGAVRIMLCLITMKKTSVEIHSVDSCYSCGFQTNSNRDIPL